MLQNLDRASSLLTGTVPLAVVHSMAWTHFHECMYMQADAEVAINYCGVPNSGFKLKHAAATSRRLVICCVDLLHNFIDRLDAICDAGHVYCKHRVVEILHNRNFNISIHVLKAHAAQRGGGRTMR